MASMIDVSLDDMIKSKSKQQKGQGVANGAGKKQGGAGQGFGSGGDGGASAGGGRKRGGRRRGGRQGGGGGGGGSAPQQAAKDRVVQLKKAEGPKQTTTSSASSFRPQERQQGTAPKGLGLMVRAIVAATRSADTDQRTKRSDEKASVAAPTPDPAPVKATTATAPQQQSAKVPVAKPVALVRAEDKLGMALEDVIKTEVKPGRKANPPKQEGSATKQGPGQEQANAGKKRTRGGRKNRLKLGKMAQVMGQEFGKRNKSQGQQQQQPPQQQGQRGRQQKAGSRGAADSNGKWKHDMHSTLGDGPSRGGGAKRRFELELDNGRAGKRMRMQSQGSFGWGRGGSGIDDGPWGSSRGSDRSFLDRDDVGSRLGRAPRISDWSPVRPRPVREQPARRDPIEREERASRRVATASGGGGGAAKIRVSKVPKGLTRNDVKECFEDAGRVLKCEVERGVAIISFASLAEAKKAVATYDRGELNGQAIFVSLL